MQRSLKHAHHVATPRIPDAAQRLRHANRVALPGAARVEAAARSGPSACPARRTAGAATTPAEALPGLAGPAQCPADPATGLAPGAGRGRR